MPKKAVSERVLYTSVCKAELERLFNFDKTPASRHRAATLEVGKPLNPQTQEQQQQKHNLTADLSNTVGPQQQCIVVNNTRKQCRFCKAVVQVSKECVAPMPISPFNTIVVCNLCRKFETQQTST